VGTGTVVPTDDRSFRYRIPAQMTAEIRSTDKSSYGKAVMGIAQYGSVASLPAKRNSKTLSYDLGLVEATGALKSFKLGSTGGLDSATIDALTGVSNDVLDARTKARTAAKAQRDLNTAS
jgi:hypothetical protein